MKTLSIVALSVLSIWACTTPASQSADVPGNDTTMVGAIDSATYAEQKLALKTEINQLLDSINLTIDHIEGLRKPENEEAQNKFNIATEQLMANRDVVERHLDEVKTISENSWDVAHTDRIHMHLMKARKELELVREDVLKGK